MGLMAAPALISTVAKPVAGLAKVVGDIGNLFSKHPKDKSRIQHEQRMTEKALTGDVDAARDMYGHKDHAATAAAKNAARAGWETIVRERPEVAREAQRLGPIPGSGNYEDYKGERHYISPLLDELGRAGASVRESLDNSVREVRETAASTIQRIGSGTVSEIARDVAPPDSELRKAITIPTTQTQLLLVGAVVLVLVLLAVRR